jgi:hypothetical protein
MAASRPATIASIPSVVASCPATLASNRRKAVRAQQTEG